MICPYCVISLMKIYIYIEWLYSTPKVCHVINIYTDGWMNDGWTYGQMDIYILMD